MRKSTHSAGKILYTTIIYFLLNASAGFALEETPNEVLPPDESERIALDKIIRMRDPFLKPDLRTLVNKGSPKSELQLYAVQDFELSGIISGGTRLRAMLLGPNGKSFFVREGDKIGVKDGVVKKIKPDSVVVRETEINLIGKKEEVLTVIRLADKGSHNGDGSSGFSTAGKVEIIRGEPKAPDQPPQPPQAPETPAATPTPNP